MMRIKKKFVCAGVVASLGDSVIGSTGAAAPNLFKVRTQYRGVSFSSGADGNWRGVTTLPNILRVFNPGLRGGSVGTGGETEPGSGLNLASPGATSRELVLQAQQLADRLAGTRDQVFYKLIGYQDFFTII